METSIRADKELLQNFLKSDFPPWSIKTMVIWFIILTIMHFIAAFLLAFLVTFIREMWHLDLSSLNSRSIIYSFASATETILIALVLVLPLKKKPCFLVEIWGISKSTRKHVVIGLLSGAILAGFGCWWNWITVGNIKYVLVCSRWAFYTDLIVYGFVANLIEEFFFRSIFLRVLYRHTSVPVAVIASSAFYAAHHNLSWHAPSQLLYLFGLGIILSVLFLRTRNLTSSVICHGLHNIIFCSLGYLTC